MIELQAFREECKECSIDEFFFSKSEGNLVDGLTKLNKSHLIQHIRKTLKWSKPLVMCILSTKQRLKWKYVLVLALSLSPDSVSLPSLFLFSFFVSTSSLVIIILFSLFPYFLTPFIFLYLSTFLFLLSFLLSVSFFFFSLTLSIYILNVLAINPPLIILFTLPSYISLSVSFFI